MYFLLVQYYIEREKERLWQCNFFTFNFSLSCMPTSIDFLLSMKSQDRPCTYKKDCDTTNDTLEKGKEKREQPDEIIISKLHYY